MLALSLNLKRYFTRDNFWGFEDRHFGQFGTINARYISRY